MSKQNKVKKIEVLNFESLNDVWAYDDGLITKVTNLDDRIGSCDYYVANRPFAINGVIFTEGEKFMPHQSKFQQVMSDKRTSSYLKEGLADMMKGVM